MSRRSRNTYRPRVVRAAGRAAAGPQPVAAPSIDSLVSASTTGISTDTPDYEKVRGFFDHIGSIRTLEEWLQHTQNNSISTDSKLAIVTATIKTLEGVYVHRRLKSVLYAVDPIQELRLLEHRLRGSPPMQDRAFHEEMLRILKQLNDMHTAYRLPPPYRVSVAFLPFLLGCHYSDDGGDQKRHYLVTRTLFDAFGPPHPWFTRGVEVLTWNGTPIDVHIGQSTGKEEGSNPDADRALALHFMTVRWLAASYPPDSPWVELHCRLADDTEKDIRLRWHVLTLNKDPKFVTRVQFLWALSEPTPALELLEDAAINLGNQVHDLSRWGLFRPNEVLAERAMAAKSETLGLELERVADFGKREELRDFTKQYPELSPPDEGPVPSLLTMFLEPRYLRHAGQMFGYIRIRAFPLIGTARDQFVPEFRRLLSLMPCSGLIVDIRGNPGGSSTNAETLLQLLSPNEIAPIDFQFAATEMTDAMVSREPGASDFTDWASSIGVAKRIGAEYSAARPITSVTEANQLGQEYFGPIVVLTDAMSYSAADIFAAGFYDNGVGKILGVDESTGGGGSNVWFHREAVANGWLPGPELPANVDLQVSARRCLRIKDNSGTVLEDLGVKTSEAGVRHMLTRADLLDGAPDLLGEALAMLAKETKRDLDVRLRARGDMLVVRGSCVGMDQLDFYLNERPVKTVLVDNAHFDETFGPFDIDLIHLLEIRGFDTSSGVTTRVAWHKQTIFFEELRRDATR